MTLSEFDTLRSDLAGLRTDIDTRISGLDARITGLRTDIDSRFTALDIRFARLEAKVDEKPGAIVIYQAALGMFTGMFAVMIGTVVVLKTIGIIH
jgi:hypothetical protein